MFFKSILINYGKLSNKDWYLFKLLLAKITCFARKFVLVFPGRLTTFQALPTPNLENIQNQNNQIKLFRPSPAPKLLGYQPKIFVRPGPDNNYTLFSPAHLYYQL